MSPRPRSVPFRSVLCWTLVDKGFTMGGGIGGERGEGFLRVDVPLQPEESPVCEVREQ